MAHVTSTRGASCCISGADEVSVADVPLIAFFLDLITFVTKSIRQPRWAMCTTIAHNLIRWLATLGLEIHGLLVGKTIRRRFLALPGRMTRRARRRQLHLLTNWPWAEQWTTCFERLCALRT
jgi:hypothetical protein